MTRYEGGPGGWPGGQFEPVDPNPEASDGPSPLNWGAQYPPVQYPPVQYPPVQYPPPGYGYPPPPAAPGSALAPRPGPGRIAAVVVISVLAVIVLVAAAVFVGVLVKGGTDRRLAGPERGIDVPSRAGDFHQLTGSVANRVVAQMRSSSSSNDLLTDAKIAIYATSSSEAPALAFIGVAARDSSSFAAELRRRSGPAEMDAFFRGAGVTDAVPASPGALGGLLRCGTAHYAASATVPICAWLDHSTLGVVFSYDDGVNAADATRTLRAAAEHP